MAEDLPTEYDGIVVGTGMTESIIAAALARIGYRVLHIDREDHYSADWSTFNFRGLQEWIEKHKSKVSLPVPDDEKIKSLLEDEETTLSLQVDDQTFRNVEETVYVKEKVNAEESRRNDELECGKENNDGHNGECCSGASVSEIKTEHRRDMRDIVDVPNVPHCNETAERMPDDASDETVKQLASDDAEPIHKSETETTETTETENVQSSASNDESQDFASENNKDKEATKNEDTENEGWTFEKIKKKWRHFNIDLSPKVLHCSGDMVKLLINSDVAKYCEFKTITRILTIQDDKIIQVPCSRADVFDCKYVSMIEKRMMMKFLQFCTEYQSTPEQYKDYEDKPFEEFLKSQKLSEKIKHYVQHAIAMAAPSTTTVEALASIQRFLHSLGRYGNTAFLWPMYGSGELPQCFCRMSAVFGGIYYLQKAPVQLVLNKDKKYDGIIDSDGLRLKSKWLIMNNSYAPESLLPEGQNKSLVSRAVLLINKSMLKDWAEHISLLHLPVSDVNHEPVTLFELSYISQACPKNLYVVHLTMPCKISAKKDLTPVVEKLFRFPEDDSSCVTEDDRPCILWSVYFNTKDVTPKDLSSHCPENVFLTSGAGPQIDCDQCVLEAKSVFEKICPGEEFLPKAPNPEDIIYYDENGDIGATAGEEKSDEQKIEWDCEGQDGNEASSEDQTNSVTENRNENIQNQVVEPTSIDETADPVVDCSNGTSSQVVDTLSGEAPLRAGSSHSESSPEQKIDSA